VTPEQAQRELAKREKRRSFTAELICHVQQAAMVKSIVETEQRDFCVLAGRQSGKSFGGVMAALLLALSRPKSNIIYVTSTKDTVAKMAFLPAVDMRDTWCLPFKENKSVRSLTCTNGSRVYFMGADSDKTIQRLRGTPNLLAVFIDECGVYSSDQLKAMIETVRPGLRPLAGKLVLLGTPSLAGKIGTWYEATINKAIEQPRFSYLDNDKVPSFAVVEQLIDTELAALGYTRESAYFKREYLAEFAVDLAEKVYQLSDNNLVDSIPMFYQRHATGADLGVSANDALVTLGWNDKSQDVWVSDEETASGQDTIAFALMLERLWLRRKPLTISVDPGALGQKTIKTVQSMFPEIPIEEAKKPPIPIQVRAVNQLLQSGRLKLLRTSRLAAEMAVATWENGIVGSDINEHGKHSDLVPALRYVCLRVLDLLPQPKKPKTELSQEEKIDAELSRQVIVMSDAEGNDTGFMPPGDDYNPFQ
jgi:hypothetical protein